MSGDVVELDSYRPHLSGEARCLECSHTWVAVAPVGTVMLYCPNCKTDKGVLRYRTEKESGLVWRCNCGCDVFMLYDVGAPMCVRCGLRADSWAEG